MDTPASTTTYTLGDDVITQSKDGVVRHLLYDGHGSTRQLSDTGGSITDIYSYDAYGNMLGCNPTTANPAATNYLYAGEQWDNHAQHSYNRARYYNPSNGRWNRVDPFAGNNADPQSLHKYLYAHNNPINMTDPSGLISLFWAIVIIILAIVLAILITFIKAFLFDKSLTEGSTKIERGTPAYRSIEIAISFLESTVKIPSSGVQKTDITGLRDLLEIGKIWLLPAHTAGFGYSAFGKIYINLLGGTRNAFIFDALQEGKTNYTLINYPTDFGFYGLYIAASTLWHEWQHHNYDVGAWRETVRGSKNWNRTYGKEVQLGIAVLDHFDSQSDMPFKEAKITAIIAVIGIAANPK